MSSKGISAERQLMHFLKDRNYEVQHSAGSRGPMDILAWKSKYLGLKVKRFAIQVKATNKEEFRISKAEIDNLLRSARKGDYEAILGVRFGKERWRYWRDESGTSDPVATLFVDEKSDLESLKDKFKNSSYCTLTIRDGIRFEDIF